VEAPAHPPLARPCAAASLRAHVFLQGATGSLAGDVVLTNVGRRPCSLVGWPRVTFVGPAARTTRWRVIRIARRRAPPDALLDPPGSLRALRPGKAAAVELFWSNWCGPGSHAAGASGRAPDAIVLRLPSGSSVRVPLANAPRCDDDKFPSRLTVAPFTPAARPPRPSSRLPLRAAVVGPRSVRVKPGVAAFRVGRGRVLRYRIALTNNGKRPFRFAGCPAYVEVLVPSVRSQVFVLNCRPVGEIPPRATVLFDMRLRIPARARTGTSGLTWELAPHSYEPPFATAAVRIVADPRAMTCPEALLADWRDGRIDRAYPRGCYLAAAAMLPPSRKPAAEELRAEVAEAGRARLPSGRRGRRGGPHDPCPTLDQVAPCPPGLAPLGRAQLLRISGAIDTDSRRALFGGGQNTCGYRSRTRRLLFASAPMLVRGAEVARVSFELRYHGSRTYAAPVEVRTVANATTGATQVLYRAARGRVRVSYARALGSRGHYGFAGGLVAATLVDRSHRTIEVRGTWVCAAEPVANGPG
jgi:hypothetical protein